MHSLPTRPVIIAVFFLLTTLLGGCLSVPPIEPTVARLPTDTPTAGPTATPVATLTSAPIPTLPATWTPVPSKTVPPTVTLLPTYTLPPATATLSQEGQLPLVVTAVPGGMITLKLTEAQLNAALARRFDAKPLTKFTTAPRLALTDDTITLTLWIIPASAPDSTTNAAGPQTMTLTLAPAVYGGHLELRPTRLAPLDAGVTTLQVKQGQALLERTVADLVFQAGSAPRMLAYQEVSTHADGLTIVFTASS